ncbi:MAG: Ig-like domain-containing protein, partial [Deltaproteobacteria bacterium]
MADNTRNPQGEVTGDNTGRPEVAKAAVVDGVIQVPAAGSELVQVEVVDVDLLLTFADGHRVVIPNGALDALGGPGQAVLFVDAPDAGPGTAVDTASLKDLFKLVGLTRISEAGSVQLVSDSVDLHGAEPTPPPQVEESGGEESFIPPTPPVEPVPLSGRDPGQGGVEPPRELIEPVEFDPVEPDIVPRPSVYRPGQKVINTEPVVRLDAALTPDDVINIAESGGNVTVTGSVSGTAAVGDTVELTVNGQRYSGIVADDMTFAIDVAGSDLVADGDKRIDARIQVDGKEGTDSDPYSVDLTPPTPTVAIDVVTDDGVVNLAESATDVVVRGMAGGDAQPGDRITLTVNGHDYSGLVRPDGSFRIDVAGADLVADSDQTIDARIDSVDAAGNPGSASAGGGFAVDLDPPVPSVSLDPNLTGDGLINAAEAAGPVTVTGSVGGDAAPGDRIVVQVNGKDFIGTVTGGGFAVSIPGSDLVADADHRIEVRVESVDAAGNPGTATDSLSYGVDTSVPVPTIDLDAVVTADDIINIAEAAGDVAITGSTGGDARPGDVVTLTVNGVDYAGLVRADGSFSINVAGADLVADADHVIDATVVAVSASGNPGMATDSEGYGIDVTAPVPTLTLDANVTADDVVNIAEAAGTVAVTGSAGGDALPGDQVRLDINGQAYFGQVAADGSFRILVPGADLAADPDGTIAAALTTFDAAGNPGSATTSDGFTVDTVAPAPGISLDANITADDIINISEAGGLVTVTGTVTGEFNPGDQVTLTLKNGVFTGIAVGSVQADGRFAIDVAGSDLVTDADLVIEARIDTVDTAGNPGA